MHAWVLTTIPIFNTVRMRESKYKDMSESTAVYSYHWYIVNVTITQSHIDYVVYRDLSDHCMFLCFHSYPYMLFLTPTLFLYFFGHLYIRVHFVNDL